MAFVMFNQATAIALENLVNKTAPQNLVLRLFKNNWTPAVGDDETDATEADFTGYSAKTLTGASWTSTPGNPSEISYAMQEFISSANQTAQNVYGWYITQATSGKAICADRFTGAPVVVEVLNDTIRVTPVLTGESDT